MYIKCIGPEHEFFYRNPTRKVLFETKIIGIVPDARISESSNASAMVLPYKTKDHAVFAGFVKKGDINGIWCYKSSSTKAYPKFSEIWMDVQNPSDTINIRTRYDPNVGYEKFFRQGPNSGFGSHSFGSCKVLFLEFCWLCRLMELFSRKIKTIIPNDWLAFETFFCDLATLHSETMAVREVVREISAIETRSPEALQLCKGSWQLNTSNFGHQSFISQTQVRKPPV